MKGLFAECSRSTGEKKVFHGIYAHQAVQEGVDAVVVVAARVGERVGAGQRARAMAINGSTPQVVGKQE